MQLRGTAIKRNVATFDVVSSLTKATACGICSNEFDRRDALNCVDARPLEDTDYGL